MASLAHHLQKIRERGISDIIAGRVQWWKQSFQMDNRAIGRLVELTGNRVRIDGVTLDVDNPLIPTKHKSSIYFGIYEVSERMFAKRYIDRSLPTIEFGGCIGGVSCIVNKMLQDPSRHVVVECGPAMLPTLQKNRRINDCHFSIEAQALAYGTETVSFGVSEWMFGSIHQEGQQIEAPATTLGKLLNKYDDFQTINLISDCEGAEIGLTEHELPILRDRVKWFIAELHPEYIGEAGMAKMISDLERVGFVMRDRSRGNVVAMENLKLG